LPDFVDNTVKEIDARLSVLRSEVAKLEAARAALAGSGGGTASGTATRRRRGRPPAAKVAAPPAAKRARRGPGRPRGRRSGTRAAQALALVGQTPGITIPDIAKSLKIEPNYLYRVMNKLVENGSVKRDGQGWHPA
jgi:hypothetical protein